jgi:cytochrome c-type biogenesis protein CcmF
VFIVACFTVLWGTVYPVLSEWVQGHKQTVSGVYYNKVMIPVALVLLLLTAMGPLLSWRKTSLESLKRNFLWPTIGAVSVGFVLVATPTSWGSPFGLRPWQDVAYLSSLMTIMLSVLVALTVASEFVRGGRVIAGKTGQNLLVGMMQLGHRNTRRYGGYIVHVGVVLIMIGFAGTAFNQSNEKEMSYGDTLAIGPYSLVCRSYTQEETPNYSTSIAIMDVFKGGKRIDTLYPESRFYTATQQPQHIPTVRSTMKEDLYIVYEGQNPDTGRPIIKAHLNPLVSWIWVGVLIILLGTVLALFPNMAPIQAMAPVPVRAGLRAPAAPVGAGD